MEIRDRLASRFFLGAKGAGTEHSRRAERVGVLDKVIAEARQDWLLRRISYAHSCASMELCR
jgi:hypothetical protein